MSELLDQDPLEIRDVIVITTGGTIEKTYDEFDGSLANRESEIKNKIITKLRLPHTKLHVFSLMAKDSLFMTDEDRSLIVEALRVQMEKKLPIVVLHGTDTMTKTAELAFREIKECKVPIIFTGAMKPMGFEDSDSTQNLTEALLAVQLVPNGVYISFHNRIFEVPGVQKNKRVGTFEKVKP